jgi:hypothetical protein
MKNKAFVVPLFSFKNLGNIHTITKELLMIMIKVPGYYLLMIMILERVHYIQSLRSFQVSAAIFNVVVVAGLIKDSRNVQPLLYFSDKLWASLRKLENLKWLLIFNEK